MASKPNLSVVIASVLSLLALCGIAWGADSNGLISHWEFDEGSGTTAYDSAGDNDGAIYGATWTGGQIGGALSFDGVDDYVDVGNDSSLKPPLPVTLSAWVNLTSLGSPQCIMGLDAQTSDYYGIWWYVLSAGDLEISYGDGGGKGVEHRRSKVGTTALAADTWYHIAAVLRGPTDISLYINGIDDGGTYSGSGGSIAYLSASSLIGINHDSQCALGGKIDDVRIYNRALSAEEIEELYPEGGGPIAHWRFDEGSGTTAYDSAGDNDGIIYGAAWTSGQIGGALDFDGEDDYVRTLNNVFTNAQLASGATLSAWFKTDSAAYGLIADVEGYLNLGINLRDTIKPNRLFGTADGGAHIYFSSSDVTDNVWYHAAIVWDGTNTASLYLDGVNVSSRFSGPPTPDSKGRPLAIGVHSTMAAYFGGIIDDVRVYNRALSAEEIRKLYENGSSGRSLSVRPRAGPDNIERAIRGKVEAWKKIDDMLKKEREVYEALEQMLRTGDYRSSSYSDIVTARYEIYTAIEQGERSKEALEKSIENLEAALAALGFELVPKASTWLGQAKLLIR
jgi:hypothetical protein